MAPSPIEDPDPVPAHGGVDRDLRTDVGTEQCLRQRRIGRHMPLLGVRFDGVDQDDVAAVPIVELQLDLVAHLDDVGVLVHGIDSDRPDQGSSRPGDPILETQPFREAIVVALSPTRLLLELGKPELIGSESGLEGPASGGGQDDRLPRDRRAWRAAQDVPFDMRCKNSPWVKDIRHG